MIKGQSLKQLYESLGPVECTAKLIEGLEKKLFKPSDFSLRDIAESFCGPDWVRQLNPRNISRSVALSEAGDVQGVDVSAFSNITGQILFTKILEGWQDATKVGDSLCETVSTELDGEKIPWLSHPYSEGDPDIRPGNAYPETTFGERYITTPPLTKKGEIVSITKEMIFFDKTGQALKRANEIGLYVGYQKEKLILRTVMGLLNNYNLNGATFNTYAATAQNAGDGNWVNKLSGVPLVDWTSVNQAYVLFQDILDPDTGLPIIVEPKQMLVMPARLFTARRINSATEVRSTSPAFSATPAADSPGNTQTISGNPVPWQLEILTSPIAYQLLLQSGISASNAQDYWFIGDFKRAINYMQNWPITMEQAPPTNIAAFERDIALRVKVSERGFPAVVEPRYVGMFINS